MKYYIAQTEKYDYFTGYTVATNELLTAKERHSLCRYISDTYFLEIDIPKAHTFKIFGRRFIKTEYLNEL